MRRFICFILTLPFACDARRPVAAESHEGEVVLYCSADSQFARPLLAEFEKQAGITVHALFDTEAGKTTGLVERLRAEKPRPRADVWWSGEVFGTMELAQAGVLAPYKPRAAADIPLPFRGPADLWTGFGLRGRVVAYDPKRVRPEDLPRRWADFSNARYRGRFAIANPQFGTTRGHMATLLANWGDRAFADWLDGLAKNEVRLADGNAHAVQMLLRGQVDLCWTDTDDVYVAQRRGSSIAWVYPDLDSPAPHGTRIPGTLWIPNSVALVKGGPHPKAGRLLIEFLVSAHVEEQLALSDSGNEPVRSALAAVGEGPRGPKARVSLVTSSNTLRRSDDLCREKLRK